MEWLRTRYPGLMVWPLMSTAQRLADDGVPIVVDKGAQGLVQEVMQQNSKDNRVQWSML